MSANTLSDRQLLDAAFARCRAEGRAALIPFVPAGHPEPEQSLSVLLRLADAGADVIELGVPFSDPLADGPIIQQASHQAIRRGVDLAWTLELLRTFTQQRETPVIVFSYLNPVLRYGLDRFLADAAGAGACGLLLTDLPAGADPEIEACVDGSPLALVRLIAPTTTPARRDEILRGARGFVYYVSRTGVTGVQAALADALAAEVAAVRAASPVPVAVGFGISSPAQAAAVAAVADGVVVGSALVRVLAEAGIDEADRMIRSLREATSRGST